jgi:hypothetical protein
VDLTGLHVEGHSGHCREGAVALDQVPDSDHGPTSRAWTSRWGPRLRPGWEAPGPWGQAPRRPVRRGSACTPAFSQVDDGDLDPPQGRGVSRPGGPEPPRARRICVALAGNSFRVGSTEARALAGPGPPRGPRPTRGGEGAVEMDGPTAPRRDPRAGHRA